MTNEKKKPSFGLAVLCMGVIVAFIALGMVKIKIPTPTLMFLCWLIVIPFGMYLGYSITELEKQAVGFISRGLQAVLILLSVGAMIGTWVAAGTVPTIIYAGLKIISPKMFLFTALIFATIVSVATGTSWGTIGTAGVAIMGIGAGLGVPSGITAGAVICGAYFGDKMSPMSDGSNLCAAITGVDIVTHIKHMLYSAIPGYIITSILFLVIGFRYGSGEIDCSSVNIISEGITSTFKTGFIAVIPALVVIILLAKRISPVFSILSGATAGLIVSVLYQGLSFKTATTVFYAGYKGAFDNEVLATLFNRGGVASMFGIVSVAIFALGFSGILNSSGILDSLVKPLIERLKSVGGLVGSTMIAGYVNNMIGCSAGFSIIITGTLMDKAFKKFGLKAENLSRILADTGTFGSVLIPWNTNALFAMSMLQVSFIEYVPFTFLCYITPIITLIFGISGYNMTKIDENEKVAS